MVTSGGAVLGARELKDVLGLRAVASEALADARTGKNERYGLIGFLR
jgi:hypothetical protein